MFKKIILFLLLLTSSLFGAKLPELTPKDVTETLRRIMEAHVSCKELNLPLITRALEHYLEQLDPTKIYLLEGEVEPWLHPSDQLVAQISRSMAKGDFSHFEQMHAQMTSAIARRQALEVQYENTPLPEKVTITEFKELPWAKNEEELAQRLLKIKALQITAAKKLDESSQEKALKRIAKNRSSREEELSTSNPEERERLILANVLKAFAASFDAHTAYFTPQEAAQFMIQVQQRLFGIGAQLRDDLNGFSIVKIIEGGPASRNTGLKVNDRIIAINSEPVVGLEITEAVELIRGEEGSIVTLTVLREELESEEKIDIEIIRGEVVIQEARIESKMIPLAMA